jgi:hypothetical protein
VAGTNAYAYKKALIDKIKAFPAYTDVQVEYSWPGARFERECIHGGRVEGQQEYATFAGGRARLPRNETFVVYVYVAVRMPDANSGEDVERRLVELGQQLEDGIAADPQVAGVNGLLYAGITGVQMDSYAEDDKWAGALEYQVTVHSRLN